MSAGWSDYWWSGKLVKIDESILLALTDFRPCLRLPRPDSMTGIADSAAPLSLSSTTLGSPIRAIRRSVAETGLEPAW